MARKTVAKAAPKAAKKTAAKKSSAAPKKTATKAASAPKKTAAKTAAKSAAPKAVKVTATPGKAVTQTALLQMVADQQGLTRAEAKRLVDAYLDIVKAHVLKGVKVKLGDMGTIMVRARKARMGRNPRTGDPVKIKASKKLAFRQSATMREAVS